MLATASAYQTWYKESIMSVDLQSRTRYTAMAVGIGLDNIEIKVNGLKGAMSLANEYVAGQMKVWRLSYYTLGSRIIKQARRDVILTPILRLILFFS